MLNLNYTLAIEKSSFQKLLVKIGSLSDTID
jgi:hypothetical protein